MTENSADSDVPVEVTIREITELVRQFEASGWSSLELDIGGMHLVLGRDGAPAHRQAPVPATAPSPATPATAESPAPAAAAAPAQEAPAPAAPAPASSDTPSAPIAPSEGTRRIEVRAPVVGSFWVAPSPGQPPFVNLGDEVTEGQQLAIVEVMKLMSDISAPAAGRIVEICAKNAELVEFEQVLFVLEVADD